MYSIKTRKFARCARDFLEKMSAATAKQRLLVSTRKFARYARNFLVEKYSEAVEEQKDLL